MTFEQQAAEVERLQTAIALLVAGVFIAIGYILKQPVAEYRPPSKVVEHCKLHSRPVSECRDQHKLDG